MKPWSTKRKRIVIGILMMYGFLNLINSISFFANIAENAKQFFLVFLLFHYFWLPAILLIVLCYHILMKVYKYEDAKDELERDKVQTVQELQKM